VTTFPARPTIPARPAAHIWDADATTPDDPDMTAQCNMVISLAQDLGWPVPAVYADAGQADQPGSQLAALVEAITAGRHDGVFATRPAQISHDLAQIEAFDRLCRQHGIRLRFRWCQEVTDPRDNTMITTNYSCRN
jgi:hypothetical protein